MRTWGQARDAARKRLASGADPATAALDADVLLAHALGVTKEELLAHPERVLGPDEDARCSAFVERRHRGEPVAYLRGFKEFFGFRVIVDARVLIPRPETETLVEEALRFVGRADATRPVTVVDVGTGSGAIACAIALHAPRARVIGIDLSADALAVAAANARSLGVADRVTFLPGDLLAPLRDRVDVVCANLPYLRDEEIAHLTGDRTSLAFEPRIAVAAGPDGLALIRRTIADLPRVLARGGAAFFECDPPQAEPMRALMTAAGFETWTARDLAGSERVVAGRLTGPGTR